MTDPGVRRERERDEADCPFRRDWTGGLAWWVGGWLWSCGGGCRVMMMSRSLQFCGDHKLALAFDEYISGMV